TNRLFRSVGVEIVSATATARSAASASAGSHALTASAQHPEIVRHNLKARSLLSFFVLPFTRLNAAFDKNERALLQILLRNLRLFPPHDDLVPLRPLLPFAIAVFIRFVRGHGKIGDRLSTARVTCFGIASQTPDQDYLVD